MASAKQFIEKRDNIAAIVAYVRSRGGATRMEISRALSLSWACVSELTASLVLSGVMIEVRRSAIDGSESKGRTPGYLVLSEKKYFLGVDINDSGMAISVLGINGKLLRTQRWDAEPIKDEEELKISVCEKIASMLDPDAECLGIGVAMEGQRGEDGSWGYPLSGGIIPIKPEIFIEERFKLPVSVRHDPECMLYAVADESDTDCMAVRVDSGVGVAAMRRGRMLDLPLELGFISVKEKNLRSVLVGCAKSKDYGEIAEELGVAVGNLAMLLGVKKVFIVGMIIDWLGGVKERFDSAFKRGAKNIEYEVSTVSDASWGAARVAMAEYPVKKESATDASKS